MEGRGAPGSARQMAAALEKKPTFVCFWIAPDRTIYEMKINEQTKELLDLCDGRLPVESIAAKLARDYGMETGPARAEFQANLMEVLQQLQDTRIIIFD